MIIIIIIIIIILVLVDSYFYLSLTTRRVYSSHILITSLIDKLYKINIEFVCLIPLL